ncbi:MAG TPA: hypothetical protein VGA04_35605 [Streptosporangiaceae bacterium]
MRNLRGSRRSAATLLGAVLAVVGLVAGGCQGAAPAKPAAHKAAVPTAAPVGPHGGVNLNVLVVTDGTPPVEAVRQQLTTEGMPFTVVNLHDSSRPAITSAFLSRTLPDGTTGGNFDGIVLPSATPSLSGAEEAALAAYEHKFGVRQVDAYAPPKPNIGMNAPVYSGPLSGTVGVTSAGATAGFGYLNGTFPFSGGAAGPAPFGYLAQPVPGGGATPLLTAAIPQSSGSATLVWQYDHAGRQELVMGFGYGYYQEQFHYLAHGIVDWLTRGVHLGDWRNYLDVAYDDMILGDAQWSTIGHCTPGDSVCPKGTPQTATIRMTPADVTYAVQWEKQHNFAIEFLYNGGASVRFRVNGVDPLLVATRPVAKDFYWVNHTYTHAYFGCQQDFSVVPWKCVESGGRIVWAAGTSLINSQIFDNFSWARRNGIPAEPGVLASGEYSGLRILPQQPVDNPALDNAMGPDKIKWVAMDASRELSQRHIGAALGVPRHPIDVGYDVDTVANEVNEFNWFNTSKADGGSGRCQSSKTTRCLQPLDPKTGWTSFIVPGQVQIVYRAVLNNDPRPFFMHQSNLTADRLGYPVMDGVLSAYRAVYGASAPIVNLPMSGDGAVLHNQAQWAQALRAGTVSAWVQGNTVTVSGPPGTVVPVTVPAGTTVGSAAGLAFGSPYAGERSSYTTLGSRPLKLALNSAPYLSGGVN